MFHERGRESQVVVPLIAVGEVRIDLVSIEPSAREQEQLRPALESPAEDEAIPIVPLTALIYMKLKANRQRDLADLVELLKRGKIEIGGIDRYLDRYAPEYTSRWDNVKAMAAKEER